MIVSRPIGIPPQYFVNAVAVVAAAVAVAAAVVVAVVAAAAVAVAVVAVVAVAVAVVAVAVVAAALAGDFAGGGHRRGSLQVIVVIVAQAQAGEILIDERREP